MLKVNEYFQGNVKSIGFDGEQGPVSVGVMEPGDYEFGTAKAEVMHVVTGSLIVKLPGSEQWQTFATGSKFDVPADSSFQLQVKVATAYLCEYVG